MGVVAPAFYWSRFAEGGWAGVSSFHAGAIGGMIAAVPFAIWFFLAIEGVAMAAEEARDPRRTIPIAYVSGILTLTGLAFGVMILAGGAGDWRALSTVNDPLPQAMKSVVGTSNGWMYMLVWLGLFGLVASFHGIIMAYVRQIFALSRAGYLPAVFADLISIAGQSLTASIVTMSAFGALVMYLISMASLFRLRRTELSLDRPYQTPFYPFAPLLALAIGGLSLMAMAWFNREIFAIFNALMVILVGGSLWRRSRVRRPVTAG